MLNFIRTLLIIALLLQLATLYVNLANLGIADNKYRQYIGWSQGRIKNSNDIEFVKKEGLAAYNRLLREHKNLREIGWSTFLLTLIEMVITILIFIFLLFPKSKKYLKTTQL